MSLNSISSMKNQRTCLNYQKLSKNRVKIYLRLPKPQFLFVASQWCSRLMGNTVTEFLVFLQGFKQHDFNFFLICIVIFHATSIWELATHIKTRNDYEKLKSDLLARWHVKMRSWHDFDTWVRKPRWHSWHAWHATQQTHSY